MRYILFCILFLSSCDLLVVRDKDRTLWNEDIAKGKSEIRDCVSKLREKPSVISFKIKVYRSEVLGKKARTMKNKYGKYQENVYEVIFDGETQNESDVVSCIIKVVDTLEFNLSDSRLSHEVIQPILFLD